MVRTSLSTPWSSTGIALLIFIHDGEWLISHPDCFTPRKESQNPLNTMLGGPQRQSAHFTEEKNFLPLQGFEPQTVQPIPTTLTQHILNAMTNQNKHSFSLVPPLSNKITLSSYAIAGEIQSSVIQQNADVGPKLTWHFLYFVDCASRYNSRQ